MTSSPALGLALALAASVALSASFLLQHAGSATAVAVTPRRPLRTIRSLLASPTWALGLVVGLAGWAMHVGALSRAPLSLVQAFVSGGLVLTVPMAAIGLRRPPGPGEKRGTAVMVAALVLLSLGLRAQRADALAPAVLLAAYLCALALAAGLAAGLVRGARRPAALAAAGGALYGGADLAIKALTSQAAHDGASGVLRSPWTACAACLTVAAFFAFQRALQSGRPVTMIALMTAATNVTSVAGGFAVFGDQLGRTPALALAHAAGFALVAVAAWSLAPSQAALTADAARA